MKKLFALASLFLLVACGSGGPPPPDWKTFRIRKFLFL